MILKKVLLLLFVIGILFPFVSSAHYIVGYVNDALDGTDSENHTIMMWNPLVGIADNLIGSIGSDGASGQESMYLLDCDLLNSGCSVNDVLSLQVVDSGDGYISNIRNITVTGAGYDFAENITLNSPPNVSLNYPFADSLINDDPVQFNCSFSDLDGPYGNLTLWGNWSGSWQEEQRYGVGPGDLTHVFSEPLGEGDYLWTCLSEDNLFVSTFEENRTFRLDLTLPTINQLYLNESYGCGEQLIEATCETNDSQGIYGVTIEAVSPTYSYNYSANFIGSNNYSSTLSINETGEWIFNCYSEDNASNLNSFSYGLFNAQSGYPEIYVNSSKIFFNKESYVEGDEVNISSVIENVGCVDSSNFIVSFFEDDPSFENQIGNNFTISLLKFSSFILNVTDIAFTGRTNVFVFADRALEIIESNESDNVGNNSYFVPIWQEFYGNVSAVKVLKDAKNFTSWSLSELVVGNVFVTDSESEIDWFSLKAIGEDSFGNEQIDDFSEIDSLLGISAYEDSISSEYLEGGVVKGKRDFLINKENITGVPVTNSTDSENFLTGILWDSSDTIVDDEFDSTEKEDLVFVTKINNSLSGKYGDYDYEIKVPAELKNYYAVESSEVYFYYDLV